MPVMYDRLVAAQAMHGAALLNNDPAHTDYTYDVIMPYLNMAIYELNEHLAEANAPATNQIEPPIMVFKGENHINNLPYFLINIQEIGERPAKTNDVFRPLPRKEFAESYPPSDSLLFWAQHGEQIVFNQKGASIDMEVQLKYIQVSVKPASTPDSVVGPVIATMFLMYKTGAFLAQFIGENQSRSSILNEQAELALERIIGIGNKSKQQTMTRHRPFRAGYKMRSY
jgi:hypothetical protein